MPEQTIECSALLYHNVGPVTADECRGLTVTPESFSRQMAALDAMGFKTIRPIDWFRSVQYGNDIPSRATMITFDDAYSSLIEHAFPALLKHGFTATVFVPTALVGKSIACNPDRPGVTLPIMSREQISEWAAKGIEFGAHSRNHADLTSIAAGDAYDEMEESREYLSELTGRPVDMMAYPYGQSNEAVREQAAALFRMAFTIEEGVNDHATSLLSLKRTMVQHGDTVADICLRAAYGRSAIAKVRTMISRTVGGPAKRTRV